MDRILKAMTAVGTHAVGNLNNWNIDVVPYGAIVTGADIDNFTICELSFDADGERTVAQLSVKTNKAYLVAAPERRYEDIANLADFYNEVGERARIVILNPNQTRFETSAFTKNAGLVDIINGNVAHFDVATKKFIVSAVGTAHLDYATSTTQFVVVANPTETDAISGQPLIRLECSKS